MVSIKSHYNPLDSLRGIAAVMILLFHTKDQLFKPFWIGVPVFFVLSGFLITSILLESKNSENYFKVFYFRRSLRIFPIYYLVLLIATLISLYAHLDTTQLGYYMFYLQSFTISYQIMPTFSDGLMLHSWSLSVEELFYLFWPFIILRIEENSLLKIIKFFIFSVILFKITYPFFYYGTNIEYEIFLSLIGNLDTLFLGALLAIVNFKKKDYNISKNKILYALLLLLCLIGINYISFPNITLMTILKVLLSTIASITTYYYIDYVVINNNDKSSIPYFIDNKFLQYLGKISYGLYLYHFVIYWIIDAVIYHFSLKTGYEITLISKNNHYSAHCNIELAYY